MKVFYVFAIFFVVFSTKQLQAELLEPFREKQQHPQDLSAYLKDLEELGYCVIPAVFSREETKVLYRRVWEEFIEKAWPNCKRDDRRNWKKTFPMHNSKGTFAGPAGQTQVMWDVRQDPRIIQIFSTIWNTDDLISSMDGMGIMCPPEIREGDIEPWMHVDQSLFCRQDGELHNNHTPNDFVSESSLKTQPYTIQGQFLFEDSLQGDGGFYCVPKSHLRFAEFAPTLDHINQQVKQSILRKKMRTAFLERFFSEKRDSCGSSYQMKQVEAPAGSLILWDSRTVHWNQHASIDRPHQENPKVRMVGYLCYVPKSRLTSRAKALRQMAWENGVSTGHNPACPEIKYTKDYIWEEYMHYLEDENYQPQQAKLSFIGRALLGIYE